MDGKEAFERVWTEHRNLRLKARAIDMEITARNQRDRFSAEIKAECEPWRKFVHRYFVRRLGRHGFSVDTKTCHVLSYADPCAVKPSVDLVIWKNHVSISVSKVILNFDDFKPWADGIIAWLEGMPV